MAKHHNCSNLSNDTNSKIEEYLKQYQKGSAFIFYVKSLLEVLSRYRKHVKFEFNNGQFDIQLNNYHIQVCPSDIGGFFVLEHGETLNVEKKRTVFDWYLRRLVPKGSDNYAIGMTTPKIGNVACVVGYVEYKIQELIGKQLTKEDSIKIIDRLLQSAFKKLACVADLHVKAQLVDDEKGKYSYYQVIGSGENHSKACRINCDYSRLQLMTYDPTNGIQYKAATSERNATQGLSTDGNPYSGYHRIMSFLFGEE